MTGLSARWEGSSEVEFCEKKLPGLNFKKDLEGL